MKGGADRHSLSLVGPFRLRDPDGVDVRIPSKKSRALLSLLALAPEGLRARRWLLGMLWGGRFREQAQASLRRELASLHKTLDEAGAGALLVSDAVTARLALDLIDVDVLSLGPGLHAGGAPDGADFLEDLAVAGCPEFDDWLHMHRMRVRELRRAAPPHPGEPPGALEIVGGLTRPIAELLSARHPDLPPKPSVCVLSFRTLGESKDDLLGHGIAEELGTTLARFPSMFVVATPSGPGTGGDPPFAVDIARRLGVAYLIDGSAMVVGGRLRVQVRLIDGATGRQIWGRTEDGSLEDIFAVQRAIAEAVAPRIHTEIDITELRDALVNPMRSADAYALYWRANALFRQWTREALTEARDLCETLVAMQPASCWAAAMAAFCHAVLLACGWADDPAATRRAASRHYQQAIRHGGEDPAVLGYAAGTLICIDGDLEVADRLVAHALTLLPSYQPTLFWGGWVDLARGIPDRARERFELSLRVNPAAGVRAYALAGIGVALLMEGDWDGAFAFLRDAVQFIPDYPVAVVGHCVAAALSGHTAHAKEAAARVRDTGAMDAVATVFRDPRLRAMIEAGVRMAEGS